jgi:hypothetical protein
MKLLTVYARLYAKCLLDAVNAIGKNSWTVLLPMGLALVLSVLRSLFAPLGMAGGFLSQLVYTAVFSVFTSFVADVVARNKTSLKDLKASIGAYFFPWMNVFFVLWVAGLLLRFALPGNVDKAGIVAAFSLLQLVALNAVPEVIYLKHPNGGIDTVRRGLEFLQAHWIEWFVPNGVLVAGAWFLFVQPADVVLRVYAVIPLGVVVVPILMGVAFHFAMVFRGFLFQALDGSTHRQRMFRYGGRE